MSVVATVHLVRHGEVHNPDKVLYGRLPGFHLSELGYQMADELADWFSARAETTGKRPEILAVSPLLRAQETAAPLSKALDLPIRTDERLIEAGSNFQGLNNIKKRLLNPLRWVHLLDPFRPSWGESYENQVKRMTGAIFDLRDELLRVHGGGEAVIVSHQLPIWVTRLSAERTKLWHDPRKRECSLTSVTSLHFDPGYHLPRVEYQEPNAHLSGSSAALPGVY